MLLSLYRSLTNLGEPLIRAYLRYRLTQGREDSERFGERFGYPSRPRPRGKLVWCHAVSVGEASSLLLLIEKIHDIHPDHWLLLTTGTVTAAEMVGKRLPSYAIHQYVPVDLPSAVARFLDYWKPKLAVWIESELWPNTLASLRERSVPAVLLNARMSKKSFGNWKLVKGFAAELLSTFHLCLAQTEADKTRFEALGAKPVRCVGNLKYAAAPLPYDMNELKAINEETKGRFLWLMASTHAGEEEVALKTDRALAARHPRLLTVIAPRHAVRGDEVARKIEAAGLKYARRSKDERITEETQVYLADTIGEMGLFYALCPITVIGGSFAGTGGHNPIEPARLGSAIIFGPSMFNFSEIAQEFISEKAAIRLENAGEIASAVDLLWMDGSERDRQIQAARLLAEQKRSILNQIIVELAPWFK